jgi:hypothetical protein
MKISTITLPPSLFTHFISDKINKKGIVCPGQEAYNAYTVFDLD